MEDLKDGNAFGWLAIEVFFISKVFGFLLLSSSIPQKNMLKLLSHSSALLFGIDCSIFSDSLMILFLPLPTTFALVGTSENIRLT